MSPKTDFVLRHPWVDFIFHRVTCTNIWYHFVFEWIPNSPKTSMRMVEELSRGKVSYFGNFFFIHSCHIYFIRVKSHHLGHLHFLPFQKTMSWQMMCVVGRGRTNVKVISIIPPTNAHQQRFLRGIQRTMEMHPSQKKVPNKFRRSKKYFSVSWSNSPRQNAVCQMNKISSNFLKKKCPISCTLWYQVIFIDH